MSVASAGKNYAGLVVVLIFILALIPTIVTQVQDVNTTGWSFTAYEGAETLLLLIPFVVIAGAVLFIISRSLRS